MIGWRARLGFLLPPGNPTVEPEMMALAPHGVWLHFNRVVARGAPGSLDGQTERNRMMIDNIGDSIEMLALVQPDVIVLAHTATSYHLGRQGEADLVARLEGKSSLGRLGLLIHSTAGFVDAGWDGHLTLELSNVANLPITLYPGMKIGQISFLQMTSPAENPYGSKGLGSKYQGQRGPTPSRYFENFRR